MDTDKTIEIGLLIYTFAAWIGLCAALVLHGDY